MSKINVFAISTVFVLNVLNIVLVKLNILFKLVFQRITQIFHAVRNSELDVDPPRDRSCDNGAPPWGAVATPTWEATLK